MIINEITCLSGKLNGAISIRALKRFVVDSDNGKWKQFSKKLPPTGKKVAIVGSGPAGLTAGYYLAKLGHSVTIFETLNKAGGMMRVGIPDYRLPKDVLDAEIEEIQNVGVDIKLNTRITSVDWLFRQGYHAVFLALGAHRGIKLGIAGDDNSDIIDGAAFLRNVNSGVKVNVGERVAVIGGGYTAIDSARTAMRIGAEQVQIIYRRSQTEMPASDDEVNAAIQEGIKITFLATPVKISKVNNKINLTCIHMKLGEIDESGRRSPVPIKDSEFSTSHDKIIAAIGQIPDVPGTFSIKTNADNTLLVDHKTLAASRQSVWAGGDAVTGPATVIEAIAAGRKAATAIDKYLGGTGIIDEKLTKVRRIVVPDVEDFPGKTRVETPYLIPKQRIRNFSEMELCLTEPSAVEESNRCLHCGNGITARCRYACPVGINIPLYVHLIRKGKYEDALAIIREKVPFPGVLGRICTSPCEEACMGCAMCLPYCPMSAIGMDVNSKGIKIDQDECVECGVCFRAKICPTDAIYQQELTGPRLVRAAFSNPFAIHPVTNMRGRGTEEMKTNEVTGRFRRGFAGVAIEMGRPVLGTNFRDLETVAMAVAKIGVTFEPQNPVTAMMADKKTGKIDESFLEEKALTAIIEFLVKEEKLEQVLRVAREVSKKIDTVFSMSVISRMGIDGKIPSSGIIRKAGYSVRPNMKINLGLGKPLKMEV